MTGRTYDQVFIQLARGYEFIIIDDGLGLQLRIKTISTTFWCTGLTNIY